MARTRPKVLVALSLPWGQAAPSLPTAPILCARYPKAHPCPPWAPSPLPERWYQALISHVAAASRITGDLSQAVAVVFAGGDTVTMNHPGEAESRAGAAAPGDGTDPAPPWVCSVPCTLQGWVSRHPRPRDVVLRVLGARSAAQQPQLTQVGAHGVV